MYETRFGIYDHTKKNTNRPLASVAMHISEDINADSLLEEIMDTYLNSGIGEYFRISFDQFMKLPHDVVELMIKRAEVFRGKKNQIANNLESELGIK